jgi:hypothetical protein
VSRRFTVIVRSASTFPSRFRVYVVWSDGGIDCATTSVGVGAWEATLGVRDVEAAAEPSGAVLITTV